MPQSKTEKSNFGKRKESIHCFTSLSDQEKSNINIVMPKKLTPIENSHLFLSNTSRQPGQNKKKWIKKKLLTTLAQMLQKKERNQYKNTSKPQKKEKEKEKKTHA